MKNYFLVLLLLCNTCNLFAQVPQGIPYQSAMRNSSGGILANQNISIRFSLHDSVINGSIVYQETHSTTTNNLGLVSLTIGQGTATIGLFVNIDWAQHAKFLQVEMDPAGGTNYVDLGTQQMMSVPYALVSETVRNLPLPTKYSIGLHSEIGGYVFSLSTDSLHGLVCEIQDQSSWTTWLEASSIVSNPSNHSLIGQKFSDWRLPTKFELQLIYPYKDSIGNFINNVYCTSNEGALNTFVMINLADNSIYGAAKDSPTTLVRAIRSF